MEDRHNECGKMFGAQGREKRDLFILCGPAGGDEWLDKKRLFSHFLAECNSKTNCY